MLLGSNVRVIEQTGQPWFGKVQVVSFVRKAGYMASDKRFTFPPPSRMVGRRSHSNESGRSAAAPFFFSERKTDNMNCSCARVPNAEAQYPRNFPNASLHPRTGGRYAPSHVARVVQRCSYRIRSR